MWVPAFTLNITGSGVARPGLLGPVPYIFILSMHKKNIVYYVILNNEGSLC